MPDAIAYRGMMLPAPPRIAAQRNDEPILRPASPPSPEPSPSPLSPEPVLRTAAPARAVGPPDPTRTNRFAPDSATGSDPVLRYSVVFQPSVAPFKRFDVMDAVTPDFVLTIRDTRLRAVPVGGGPRSGRELFFGSVVLLASGGTPVPLPSVSPTSRILRFETAPAMPVRFFQDGADNFYAVVEGSGPVRLNFLTDAPATYFGSPLPKRRAADVPPALRPRVPAPVLAAADEVLRRLGIDRRATLDVTLSALVAHFRAYRAGETRPARTNAELFEKLALGGVGACRHRAYAFVILLQALGVPARFVTNEAHAFAEAWLPGAGWRRIDLGGVSAQLLLFGGDDRVPHRPRFADPFPRPPQFAVAYSAQAATTLPDPASLPPAPPDAVSLPPDPSPGDPAASEPGQASPPPSGAAPAREPTRIELTLVQRDALRGESLALEGRVQTLQGHPVPGVRVEIHLSRGGTLERRQLGVLLTDEEGSFRARLPLPRDVDTGRYQLHADASGNERFAPSSTLPQ
jgi:hypothetical protein